MTKEKNILQDYAVEIRRQDGIGVEYFHCIADSVEYAKNLCENKHPNQEIVRMGIIDWTKYFI